MKKALVATAIAAAIAAPAANAEVVVYGKVHASIDYLDYDYDNNYFNGGGLGSDDIGPIKMYGGDMKGWYVASRASRLGFKGTEDLGDGLSLIWKYETGVNVSDSPESGGIFQGTRNSYIGLAGDWGTFLYGRHDTPMKMSTGRLDLFSDQLGDYNYSTNPNNALLGPGFKDVRADNAIAYISPNWNGFTAAAAIVPGENKGNEANGLADAYSVAGMYSNNGLYLSAAYESFSSDLLNSDDSYKQWRIGAGYTMNAFTINGVYENQDGGYEEHDVWQISGAYDFGNNRVKLAYGENKGDYSCGMYCIGGDSSSKRKSWALGLDHKLSKRTTAYAVYAEAKNSFDRDGLDIGTPGQIDGPIKVRPLFGSSDDKVSGFSMGLIHTF